MYLELNHLWRRTSLRDDHQLPELVAIIVRTCIEIRVDEPDFGRNTEHRRQRHDDALHLPTLWRTARDPVTVTLIYLSTINVRRPKP